MSVDDAYRQLAQAIISFCADSDWDSAGTRTTVLAQMTQSNYWRIQGEKIIENDRFPSFEIGAEASRAALFLRDDLLKTTGQRIWGLTFTLYPNGKFHIEYDYDKPEGYEESDELISGEEINSSLSRLGALGEEDDKK